ncbi:MAG TPA: PEGA domain-containing protein, partial [Kofleriaceae bacterium]
MRLARALAVLALAACGSQVAHPIPVGLLGASSRAIGALGAVGEVSGLELRTVAVPAPPPPADDKVTPVLARIRTAYTHGDFDSCRTELASLDLAALLADGNRIAASRAVAFETGCAVGAMLTSEAQTSAARFASFGLELAETTVAPNVEALIGKEIERIGAMPRVPVMIASNASARLLVDGRPAGCDAPCTVELSPGDHVIAAAADGFTSMHKVVRIPDVKNVQLDLVPASALLAAEQWRARKGRGLPAADPTSAQLIGRFSGEPRVIVLTEGPRVTGELVVDGRTIAHADAPPDHTTSMIRDLAYEGGLLQRPPVWRRPWFLIAV